jgi:hypothetical protein
MSTRLPASGDIYTYLCIFFALCKANGRQISPVKQEINVEDSPGFPSGLALIFARLCKRPCVDWAAAGERKIVFRVMAV